MHDKIPFSIVPTFLLMMSTHVPAHLDSYVVVLKRRLAKYADLPDYKIYELYLFVLILVLFQLAFFSYSDFTSVGAFL